MRKRSKEDRKRIASNPKKQRSRLANGSKLVNADGRSAEARRWKEIYREAMERCGGRYEQSCRSYASLVIERDAFDADIAAGYVVDRWELVRIVNAISRLESRIGFDQFESEAERKRILKEDAEAGLA